MAARRSPTAHELRVWRTFIEVSALTSATVGSRLQTESGISTGDYAVMLALFETPRRRLRSSALAATIGWERSRLSHHLRRMQSRGLIRREGSAEDSRGAEIILSEEGASLFRRGSSAHLHAIQETFVSALSGAQLDQLEDIMSALASSLGGTGTPGEPSAPSPTN